MIYNVQVCSAGSRLIIQESIFSKFIAKLKERMSHFRLGNQLDKAIDMGAVVDQSQMDSVSQMVDDARTEGAEVCYLTDIRSVSILIGRLVTTQISKHITFELYVLASPMWFLNDLVLSPGIPVR